MTPATVFRLVLGVCAAAVVGGGTWLAVLGGDSTGVAVSSPGEETSIQPTLPAVSATAGPSGGPSLAPVGETPANPTAEATAPPTAETPAVPAIEAAPPAPKVARPGGPTVVPPPTEAPPITDLPSMTANEVLALSRDVQLPSGKTFEACGLIGPEGEPWPFSVHLYYTGHGGWVVATHRGDASLLFDESTRKFQVDTLTRAGC